MSGHQSVEKIEKNGRAPALALDGGAPAANDELDSVTDACVLVRGARLASRRVYPAGEDRRDKPGGSPGRASSHPGPLRPSIRGRPGERDRSVPLGIRSASGGTPHGTKPSG